MANAKWDKASVEEKLELLREDIHVIFNHLNSLANDIGNVHRAGRANDHLLKEVAKAVEAIEARLKESAKPA